MANTALQASGEGLGAASVSEYRGATTAAHFGDPQAEFDALHSACGVYDLGFRAKVSITGSDRVRWLNGMVTNNIRDLAVNQGVYAFLLNPQGRILGDLNAYNRGESILIDTDQSQTEKILATFDHFIIMDDVEVLNLSEQLTALGVAGPKARDVLSKIGIAIGDGSSLPLQPVQWQGAECTLVRGDDERYDSYEIWLAPEHVRQMWEALTSAGAVPVGSEALELRRIAWGIPRYGVDIRERDLPQETEQTRALNFSKGCYIGQEIVERIRSRGAVHRKFTGFVAEGVAAIAAGMKIGAREKEIEKEVGEVTSVARVRIAGAEKTIALGYLRREVAIPGREVSIVFGGEGVDGSVTATVTQLPQSGAAPAQEQHLEPHSLHQSSPVNQVVR